MRLKNILRQLIADERVLSPGWLVEGESDAGVVEGLADEVAALGWDVGVFFAEDLCDAYMSVEHCLTQEFVRRVRATQRTMMSSPVISLTRSRLSSFLPWPRVCE